MGAPSVLCWSPCAVPRRRWPCHVQRAPSGLLLERRGRLAGSSQTPAGFAFDRGAIAEVVSIGAPEIEAHQVGYHALAVGKARQVLASTFFESGFNSFARERNGERRELAQIPGRGRNGLGNHSRESVAVFGVGPWTVFANVTLELGGDDIRAGAAQTCRQDKGRQVSQRGGLVSGERGGLRPGSERCAKTCNPLQCGAAAHRHWTEYARDCKDRQLRARSAAPGPLARLPTLTQESQAAGPKLSQIREHVV